MVTRRQAIGMGLVVPLLPLTSGCRASLPAWSVSDTQAAALSLLHESAAAHGAGAYAAIEDVNVSYAGHWRRLVAKIQPDLVDAGFRGGSEERLLVREGVFGQSHRGPQGHKQVVRLLRDDAPDRTRVWFNGVRSTARGPIDAAALVADAYALFLLGPLLLVADNRPRRELAASLAPAATLRSAGQTVLCDVINLRLVPGLGNSQADQVALYIDRQTRLMRRVRMTLNGLESTQGALVDIDTSEHRSLFGVVWPTAFHERLRRPLPLDVHAWRLTGLDINRGEAASDVDASAFAGRALPPASSLPP